MMKKILVILATFFSLSGCVQSAITGGQAVYDREGAGVTATNQLLSMQLLHLFHQHNSELVDSRIVPVTYDQVVVLLGQTQNPSLKGRAESWVRTIPIVVKVIDYIQIDKPISKQQIAYDAWVTAKLKAKLLTQIGIDPSKIKVVTENGTVYLLGNVSSEQAGIATALAREIEGVKNVVNAMREYQYIREP